MPLFLSNFFLTVYKNWQIFLILAGAVLAYLLLRKSETSVAERLQAVEEQHRQTLAKIDLAREEERKKLEANEAQLKKRLEEITSQYDKKKSELDEKTKKNADAIVKKNAGDPDAMAAELAKVMGFQLYVPEDVESKEEK
jgi:septal ring factor EnvC (AmiA/AmiB activator)